MVVGHIIVLVGCSFERVVVTAKGRCETIAQSEDVVWGFGHVMTAMGFVGRVEVVDIVCLA